MNKYPFAYKDGSEYQELVIKNPLKLEEYIWHNDNFNLQQEITNLGNLPIVEVGGPTIGGFYFLDDIELPSKPIISNIVDNPMPLLPEADTITEQIGELIDGRQMPFTDRTVGVILMSSMSRTEDWLAQLSEDERNNPEDIEKDSKELVLAEQEEELAALGLLDFKDAKHSQRVQIYNEVNRVLCDGGIFISNGVLSDIQAIIRLDFKLVAIKQEYCPFNKELGNSQGYVGYSYDFVVQKIINED